LEDAPPEPDWTWEGYLAPGTITLLAGRPKAGKSTLAFGLFGAVSEGSAFAGRNTRATGVLLLSEERRDTLLQKQRRFNLNGSIDLLMRHEVGAESWPEVVSDAVARCKERGLGVLVIDTFDKWAPLHGDQENSSGAVNEALRPLAEAAGEGLAVLLITHQRKAGGSHGEAVRGSNALTGSVDVIVELERVGESNPDARLLRSHSRHDGTPPELVVRLGEDDYEACSDVAAVNAQAERETLRALLTDEFQKVSRLAEGARIPRSTAAKRLAEIEEEDRAIERERLPGSGKPWGYRILSNTTQSLGEKEEQPKTERPEGG
jgi:predicted ATP-dependent serine protease